MPATWERLNSLFAAVSFSFLHSDRSYHHLIVKTTVIKTIWALKPLWSKPSEHQNHLSIKTIVIKTIWSLKPLWGRGCCSCNHSCSYSTQLIWIFVAKYLTTQMKYSCTAEKLHLFFSLARSPFSVRLRTAMLMMSFKPVPFPVAIP